MVIMLNEIRAGHVASGCLATVISVRFGGVVSVCRAPGWRLAGLIFIQCLNAEAAWKFDPRLLTTDEAAKSKPLSRALASSDRTP